MPQVVHVCCVPPRAWLSPLRRGTGETTRALHNDAWGVLLLASGSGGRANNEDNAQGWQPPSLHCCRCWQGGGAPTRCRYRLRPGRGSRPMVPQCCGGGSTNSSPQRRGAQEAAGIAAAEKATAGQGQRMRRQGTTIQTQGGGTPPGWRLPGMRLPQGRTEWAQTTAMDVAL